MKQKILVTGGNGRFAKELKNVKSIHKFIFRDKKQLNILSFKSIESNIKKFKPSIILHLAGLSRPMSIHDTNICKSIDLNIIGTSNLVKSCFKNKIKLFSFLQAMSIKEKRVIIKKMIQSYPGIIMDGQTRCGSVVQMYKNSLIIRACMTEKPFIHKYAFSNVKSNFIFHEDIAKIFVKIINKKGVINIGGKSQTIYKFAHKFNKKIRKKVSKGEFPTKMDMNLTTLKKMVK